MGDSPLWTTPAGSGAFAALVPPANLDEVARHAMAEAMPEVERRTRPYRQQQRLDHG